MSELLSAALPVFGMLAFLFVGFQCIVFSDSSRGERCGYVFFAAAVVWIVLSGALLWPETGRAQPGLQSACSTTS
jgi:hypothetical protein